MKNTIPVEDKIFSEAEFGLFYLRAVITKKKAKELKDAGFEVLILDSKRHLYYINWVASYVVCDDVFLLDENYDEFSLSQKAWIVSQKCNKDITRYLNEK